MHRGGKDFSTPTFPQAAGKGVFNEKKNVVDGIYYAKKFLTTQYLKSVKISRMWPQKTLGTFVTRKVFH